MAQPAGFAAQVAAVLGGLRPEPAPLQAALADMAALTAAVRGQCAGVLGTRGTAAGEHGA